ncbi:MAG TPA: hypothetical protein VMT66_12240 [Steroidobacteraceae bacterium]|nr:hypothetical protein [Steroidobacteraceae bacterium]
MEAANNNTAVPRSWSQERIDAATAAYVAVGGSVWQPQLVRTIALDLRGHWHEATDGEIERILVLLRDLRGNVADGYAAEGGNGDRFGSPELSGQATEPPSAPWEYKRAAAEAAEQRQERHNARTRAAIEQLSPEKRELLDLVGLKGSVAEAARELDIPYTTAVSRHKSAQRDVKRLMARDGQRHAAAEDVPLNSVLGAALQSGGRSSGTMAGLTAEIEAIHAGGGEIDGTESLTLRLTIHRDRPDKAGHDKRTNSTDVRDPTVRGAEHAAMMRMRLPLAEFITSLKEE